MNKSDFIRFDAEFSIQDGKLDEFKKRVNDIIEKVKANEPNMLNYDWYLSGDGSKCYVVDTYRDSDAILVHLANVGTMLGALAQIAPITSFRVYGNPSDEVRQASGALSPQYFEHFHGFTRYA